MHPCILSSLYHAEECHLSYAPNTDDSIMQSINTGGYNPIDFHSTIPQQIPAFSTGCGAQSHHENRYNASAYGPEDFFGFGVIGDQLDGTASYPWQAGNMCFVDVDSRNEGNCYQQGWGKNSPGDNYSGFIDHYFWLGMIDWTKMRECTQEFVDRNGCTYEIMDLAKTTCVSPFTNFEQFKTISDNLSIAERIASQTEHRERSQQQHPTFWMQAMRANNMFEDGTVVSSTCLGSLLADASYSSADTNEFASSMPVPQARQHSLKIPITIQSQNGLCTCSVHRKDSDNGIAINDIFPLSQPMSCSTTINDEDRSVQTPGTFFSSTSHRFKTTSKVVPCPPSIENEVEGHMRQQWPNPSVRVISCLHMKNDETLRNASGNPCAEPVYSSVWEQGHLSHDMDNITREVSAGFHSNDFIHETPSRNNVTPSPDFLERLNVNTDVDHPLPTEYEKLCLYHSNVNNIDTREYRISDTQESFHAHDPPFNYKDRPSHKIPPKPKLKNAKGYHVDQYSPKDDFFADCQASRKTMHHEEKRRASADGNKYTPAICKNKVFGMRSNRPSKTVTFAHNLLAPTSDRNHTFENNACKLNGTPTKLYGSKFINLSAKQFDRLSKASPNAYIKLRVIESLSSGSERSSNSNNNFQSIGTE